MMSSDLFITWSYVFLSNLDQFILYSDWQGIKLGRRIFTVFWMWHRCRVRCNAMVVSNTSHVMQVSIVKYTNKNTNTNSNTVVAWNISLVVRAIMLTHPWPQQDTDNLQSASYPHFRYKYKYKYKYKCGIKYIKSIASLMPSFSIVQSCNILCQQDNGTNAVQSRAAVFAQESGVGLACWENFYASLLNLCLWSWGLL